MRLADRVSRAASLISGAAQHDMAWLSRLCPTNKANGPRPGAVTGKLSRDNSGPLALAELLRHFIVTGVLGGEFNGEILTVVGRPAQRILTAVATTGSRPWFRSASLSTPCSTDGADAHQAQHWPPSCGGLFVELLACDIRVLHDKAGPAVPREIDHGEVDGENTPKKAIMIASMCLPVKRRCRLSVIACSPVLQRLHRRCRFRRTACP